MIEYVEAEVENLVALKIIHTLNREEYDALIPEMEQKIKQFGKINIYLEIRDGVQWAEDKFQADIHFNLKHAQDIRKVAFVGNEEHEKQILVLIKPIENAEIRWYKLADRQEALDWVKN